MSQATTAAPKRLAVLLSGSGTTLQNLIDRIKSGSLRGAEIGVVLSSRSNAGGLDRAKKHGIPTVLVESRKYRKISAGSGCNKTAPDWEAMSEAVTEALIPFKPDILVLAGYMCLYKLPTAWQTGRCLNVCEVSSSDTWETVRDRVMVAEREAYPEAIQLLVDERLRMKDGIVEILQA
ncbi:hypothetical protein FOZ63_025306 [Perkinsus olseni]|uniref:phosphoribosylglycinamide formyltransferase 1 n=2 Tax=Perkinsus olseni TaxID=32597 RepID=A0A7J6PTE2_PEROL|nr:hypothetical protein FOZ63_025306 [Perkinsus olseni]